MSAFVGMPRDLLMPSTGTIDLCQVLGYFWNHLPRIAYSPGEEQGTFHPIPGFEPYGGEDRRGEVATLEEQVRRSGHRWMGLGDMENHAIPTSGEALQWLVDMADMATAGTQPRVDLNTHWWEYMPRLNLARRIRLFQSLQRMLRGPTARDTHVGQRVFQHLFSPGWFKTHRLCPVCRCVDITHAEHGWQRSVWQSTVYSVHNHCGHSICGACALHHQFDPHFDSGHQAAPEVFFAPLRPRCPILGCTALWTASDEEEENSGIPPPQVLARPCPDREAREKAVAELSGRRLHPEWIGVDTQAIYSHWFQAEESDSHTNGKG